MSGMNNIEFDQVVNLVDEFLSRRQETDSSLSGAIRSLFIARKFLDELEEKLKDSQNEEVKRAIDRIRKSIEKAVSAVGEAYQKAIEELENDPEVQAEIERLFRKAVKS